MFKKEAIVMLAIMIVGLWLLPLLAGLLTPIIMEDLRSADACGQNTSCPGE